MEGGEDMGEGGRGEEEGERQASSLPRWTEATCISSPHPACGGTTHVYVPTGPWESVKRLRRI